MPELKLTKYELRSQQTRLTQLNRYLPTLQLRKALLQAELLAAKLQLENCIAETNKLSEKLSLQAPVLENDPSIDLASYIAVKEIEKTTENIAGIELPRIEKISFHPPSYDLFDSPPWLDSFIVLLQEYKAATIKHALAEERISRISAEFKQVATRVNLFEKVLIPRCIANIKKIRIVLGDLALTAISQAKIAKSKILARNQCKENR